MYKFRGTCDRLRNTRLGEVRSRVAYHASTCSFLPSRHWHRMQYFRLRVSTVEALARCVELFDEDETESQWLECHPDITAYASVWGTVPCLFFETSGFEYICVLDIVGYDE